MQDNEIVRHYLATIYYRGMKYLDGYSEKFNGFSIDGSIRNPEQILNHINGLLLYIESFFSAVTDTYPKQLHLSDEIERFKSSVRRIDSIIASSKLSQYTYEQILQGPLSDIMLHIGEICMLRKLIGDPAEDLENYIEANISAGIY